jgi:hypothetical protein
VVLERDNPDYHIDLGRTQDEKSARGGAIAEYQKALAQERDDALTHYSLGQALEGWKTPAEGKKPRENFAGQTASIPN